MIPIKNNKLYKFCPIKTKHKLRYKISCQIPQKNKK